MKYHHYCHDIAHARVKVISYRNQGYDTLNLELVDAEGRISNVAIFFTGKAAIDGAKVDEVNEVDFMSLG